MLSANLMRLKDKQDEITKLYQEICLNIKEFIKNDISPLLERDFKDDVEGITLYKGEPQTKGYLVKLAIAMKKTSNSKSIRSCFCNVLEKNLFVVEIVYDKKDSVMANEIYNSIEQIYKEAGSK